MRTLVISDLHLGGISGADLLRRPELREPLLEALAEIDRLVLLGDVLELRHGPLREAMAAARPFFEDIGRVLAGGELILTAGNHDHALIEPWLAGRGEEREPPPLGLEQLLEPARVSSALARIAQWASPARMTVAYPGLWLREDVYATHGHYLDIHLTVPTLERLTMGAMSRLLGRPARDFRCVGDYEALGAPVFAWRDAVARDAHTSAALNGFATLAAWRALGGEGQRTADRGTAAAGWGRGAREARRSLRERIRRRALLTAFPLAVGALNRAGIGPLSREVSSGELRRAGLAAMGEMAARVGLGEAWTIFGHTHRAGPFPSDQQGEWRGPGGARLVNTGSWTYSPVFLTANPGESPYWPGTCVLVEESGPPLLTGLLVERTHAELRPPAGRPEAEG